jgi:hypothetical protein
VRDASFRQVRIDRDHELERCERAIQPGSVRGRQNRIARHVTSARICPSPEVSISSPRTARVAAVSLREIRARGSSTVLQCPARAASARADSMAGFGNIAPPARSRFPVTALRALMSHWHRVPKPASTFRRGRNRPPTVPRRNRPRGAARHRSPHRHAGPPVPESSLGPRSRARRGDR